MADKNINCLILDIGSTYTKATAYNIEKDITFIARTQSPTVIEDISVGVDNVIAKLKLEGFSFADNLSIFSTSSAAGGLRMVALGYMPKVTAKAAKEVAMNAGAKVLEVLSHNESSDYKLEVLQEINPDIILLAGGTDGGDMDSVIENAKVIADYNGKAVTIYAGNVNSREEVQGIIEASGKVCRAVPNVMPTIHKLNVKPARELIHEEFIKQITNAKGLHKLIDIISNDKVIPTPGAVLMSAELLAKGTYKEKGLGNIIVVDMGGATTDIHSILSENEELSVEELGLVLNNEKQTAYRTVEGNLGMRVSASGVIEAVGPASVLAKIGINGEDAEKAITEYCHQLEKNTEYIAQTDLEREYDVAIAATAIEVALKRHAGFYAQEFNPVLGVMPGVPIGRDLRKVKYIIGVGGVFANNSPQTCNRILTLATQNPGISLLPDNPDVLFDKEYLVYTLGILSEINQESAIKFAKQYFNIPLEPQNNNY